ncbi:MAG: hypothetical protein ACXWLR_14450 [Myxococcales bacterium]
MFRLRLHPTPSGLVVGLAVIALWALLWVWFIAQLADSPGTAARTVPALPELTALEALANPAA